MKITCLEECKFTIDDVNVRNLLLACLTIVLISSTICEHGLAQASLVWLDDFDDGNYEEWTVEGGMFVIVNNSLACLGSLLWPDVATIYHESPGAYGYWSFDIYGYTPSVWFIASSPNHRNVTGYRFARVLEADEHFFGLYRVVNGQETRIDYSPATNETFWSHIRIIREIDGSFIIDLDRTNIITVRDTNVTTSKYFVFGAYSPGGYLDNVVVDSGSTVSSTETISTSPEPIEQDQILYVIAAVLFVTSVILIAEIQKRRRR